MRDVDELAEFYERRAKARDKNILAQIRNRVGGHEELLDAAAIEIEELYTEVDDLREALRRSLRNPPRAKFVPLDAD